MVGEGKGWEEGEEGKGGEESTGWEGRKGGRE